MIWFLAQKTPKLTLWTRWALASTKLTNPEHYTPEIKEIMRRRRLFDFEKALAVKSLDNQIKKCEDLFMLQVK